MPVPILAQQPFLIAAVRDDLTDADLLGLQSDLLAEAQRRRSRGVVVDVTSLDVMDSFSVHTLRNLSVMLRLRGVETVVVGIQPGVAIAMAELGMNILDVRTALDLEEGLLYLRARHGRADRG
jgi:rsbT antagonist protein RsbS